jgi:hypothetical protein
MSAGGSGAVVRDGRFEGGNGVLLVELRVDAGGSAVLSGDVYDTCTPGVGGGYVASVRTAPGVDFDGGPGPWPAAWQDSTGATALGSVELAPVEDGGGEAVLVTLRTDARLTVLPPHTGIRVVVQRAGDELRRIGLEIETEDGVRLPDPVPFGAAQMTLREAFRAAGLAVHDAGRPSVVPAQAGGWDLTNTFSVLNDLMVENAQAALGAPSWDLHLLMLGTSTRDGLLGIMFDSADVLPRQGAAVFVGEIREKVAPPEQNRKIIQTATHELGHALNLAHRFERQVGRADSTSFMNYDWRYLGGDHRAEFWQRFAFTFDADELEFLRHAPRAALVPGAAAFHSVNYWADGTGGYSPYLPEVPVPGFDLALTPPADGPVFAFGQPVFLEITLTNATGRSVSLPPEVLDPKAGFLELLVRRTTAARPGPLADAVPFVPIMQRCFDLSPSAADVVPPDGTLRNNLNLTFGSGGFTFAEPGSYVITPLLSFTGPDGRGGDQDLVIRGRDLLIRIAAPHSVGEEHDALTLLRPDVGAWFALGGSDCLTSAAGDLEAVRERRAADHGDDDGIVAAIVRAAGIAAGRDGLRYRAGTFRTRAADPEQAAKLLNSLAPTALRTFDAHTAQSTRALARKYAKA